MYRLTLPAIPLQPYIDCYWSIDEEAPAPVQQYLVVDARTDILFTFGQPYQYIHLLNQDAVQSSHQPHFSGLRDYPMNACQMARGGLLGVRFTVGGLSAFVTAPQHEFANLTVDLDVLFRNDIGRLEAQLYDQGPDLDRQAALLDAFFLRRLKPPPSLPLVQTLANRIEGTAGQVRIERLSADAGYSIRTLDRLFRQQVGFSPKFFARVTRFQQAVAILNRDHEVQLTGVALACGYYDQSHFTREFREFAGCTPEAYRARQVRMSSFYKTA